MSGQLEVHHSALCTAPVSPNLCCRGPYPQPGHSTREALTLRPILLWQLRSSRSNAKRYCYVYTVTPYSCLCQQQGYVCAKTREGWKREMTLRDRSEEKDGGRLQREKIDGTVSLSFCIAPSDPLPPTPLVPRHFSLSSIILGVWFWGSCCVWWQCWRSPPPPRPLSTPGPHWRTWRWSWNSTRRSARASLCLNAKDPWTHTQTYAWVRFTKSLLTVKLQAKKVDGKYSNNI